MDAQGLQGREGRGKEEEEEGAFIAGGKAPVGLAGDSLTRSRSSSDDSSTGMG